jgi:cytochrome c-type biogenesis protein CcmH/NrfG
MAKENQENEKKIIVDEDWKNQAQREKEVLAAQEKQEQAGKSHGPLPPGNFAALISMLVTQALFALGAIKIEGQPDKEPDLELAKYNIDMLETLEEKTKGNLSKEEQKVLTNTLNEVRMAYVKMADVKK